MLDASNFEQSPDDLQAMMLKRYWLNMQKKIPLHFESLPDLLLANKVKM